MRIYIYDYVISGSLNLYNCMCNYDCNHDYVHDYDYHYVYGYTYNYFTCIYIYVTNMCVCVKKYIVFQKYACVQLKRSLFVVKQVIGNCIATWGGVFFVRVF